MKPARSKSPLPVTLGAVLLGAAVFKGAYLASYVTHNPFAKILVADSAIYADWARTLQADGWLGSEVFYRPPLYPYFLSLVYRILGEENTVVYALQLVMGLAILALVHQAASRVYGARAGLLAAVFCLGYAPFTFEETKILSTVTEMLLGMLAANFLLEAERRGSRIHWIAGSSALGLAIICRPNYALTIPILVLMVLVRQRRNLRGSLPALLALGLIPSSIVGLVALRNYAVGKDLVLIAANGGVTFAQGNHPRARGSMAVLPGFSGSVEEQQREETAIAEMALGRDLKPSEVSAYWFDQGLRYIREDPAGALQRVVDKLVLMASPREFGSNYLLAVDQTLSPVLRLAAVPFGVLLGFSVVGVGLVLRRGLPASALVATFFGAIVMMLLFYVNTRYRMTLAPAAAVMAGGGLDELLRVLKSRRGVAPSAVTVAGVTLFSFLAPLPFEETEILRGDADYWANLGVAYRSVNDLGRARWAYDRAIAMSPETYRYYVRKTEILAAAAADETTLARWIEEVAGRFPQEYTAQMARAELLDAEGRTTEAIQGYERALAVAPSVLRAYRRLGELHRISGDLSAAGRVLEEGLRRFPGDPELLRLRGETRGATGERP